MINRYDLIIIGGGLGGSTLAYALSTAGFKVLMLERTRQFKDRVRGEQLHPWGVGELKALGLYDLLMAACGHELPWFDIYINDESAGHRNLIETTPQRAPEVSFYHPHMQDLFLQAAVDAGAEVRRDLRVTDFELGSAPRVSFLEQGKTHEYEARLVVGADGRNSSVRKRAGFEQCRDPEHPYDMAGVLLDNVPIDEATSVFAINPDIGTAVILFPQGKGRVRAYLPHQKSAKYNFGATDGLKEFFRLAARPAAPGEIFAAATAAGPLATFDTTNTWVDHPYKTGIVLIGDAAATNDPCFGEGLSLTLRDVRVLRDALIQHDDWQLAGHAYAEAHDRYWTNLHEATNCIHQILYEHSAKGEERRAQALPLIAQDRTRFPDHLFSGPDEPFTELERRRLFGEI